METNTKALLKHFSVVFKKKATEDKPSKEAIHPGILKYVTRKELIAIIEHKYNGTIPAKYHLAEMENEELLPLIGDDLFIISYMTHQWSKKQIAQTPIPEKVLAKEVSNDTLTDKSKKKS